MSVYEKMTTIADAIRSKTGGTELLTLDGVAEAIAGISTGGGGDGVLISILEGTATDLVLPDGLVDLKTILNKSASMKSVTFPDTLETIGVAAFAYLSRLNTPIVFPASLKSIDNNAFNSCYQIPSVTFKGTPESIHSGAFNGAIANGVINCPWAEGEVANAPWGASSATINYNYTEG